MQPARARPTTAQFAGNDEMERFSRDLYARLAGEAAGPLAELTSTLQALRRAVSRYSATNVTTRRSFDADTVPVGELADVVGTLLADIRDALG